MAGCFSLDCNGSFVSFGRGGSAVSDLYDHERSTVKPHAAIRKVSSEADGLVNRLVLRLVLKVTSGACSLVRPRHSAVILLAGRNETLWASGGRESPEIFGCVEDSGD